MIARILVEQHVDLAHAVLTPNAHRILEAIESLPEDEREAFDLVRIQGMSQAEAAGAQEGDDAV